MTRKNLLALIFGLVLSLLISGIIYYYLFLETFDLFGIDSLKDPERRHGKIFFTSFATTFLTITIAILLKKRKYFSIGFGLPAIIGIVIIIVIGPTYLIKSNYYEEFDHKKWVSEQVDRIKMARKIIKDKSLLGLTKEQVINKLGTDYFGENEMNYKVYGDDCGLSISFSHDKVNDCRIYVRD